MDLSVDFMGFRLENPFLLASAPPTANADMISRGFELGWAGATIKTLIREPVNNLQNRFASNTIGKNIFAFGNIELVSDRKPELWYKEIQILKKRFPEKMVTASIMGDAISSEQWIELALGCQDAGADIIELNFSCPHGYPEAGKGAAIGQNPEYSEQITRWLKEDKRITTPIMPKLTGAVTDISTIGNAVAKAGADAICAINSIPSLMGFDLKTLTPKPSVSSYTTPGGYSGPGIKPIALRCIYDLAGNPGLPVQGSGGISSGYDAVEFMLMGSSAVQVCTSVMLSGFSIIKRMKKQMEEFMSWHNMSTPKDFTGAGVEKIRNHSELDKNFTVKFDINPEICTGCKKCAVSCTDAAYQAISMDNDKAVIDHDKCRQCSLCYQVCSFGAIQLNVAGG